MPCSLISGSGHRSGGGGQGWPFRPARPSGRKCGHQSGASIPGDVLPPACLSETSVTAAPKHCRGHPSHFRSTSELSLHSPAFGHIGSLASNTLPVAPKHPRDASKWAQSPCQPLWHPCLQRTLFPSLAAFSLLSHRLLPPAFLRKISLSSPTALCRESGSVRRPWGPGALGPGRPGTRAGAEAPLTWCSPSPP